MARVWLRDDQFERIEALLPGKVSDPGCTAANNRLFVEAVLWIARTGSPWRDLLQAELGPWNSVYRRFARWSRKGMWHQVSPSWPRTRRTSKSFSSTAPSSVPISMPQVRQKKETKRWGVRAAD